MFPNSIKKLTRVDLFLFYLYLVLIIIGAAGIGYGGMNIVSAFSQMPQPPQTPVWQTLLSILISGLMIKFFLREMLILLKIQKIKPTKQFEDGVEEEIKPIEDDNKILPFRKP